MLTQNVGHLVLEILSSNEGVQELPALIDHSVNLSTASSKVRIVVEGILIETSNLNVVNCVNLDMVLTQR